ncbi:hypothetical protein KUL152_30020 [Tenacibaculum sp. KUL152]|nr:hypothetical protein KUL152_30020 [Tenacibaculum sp. KUL152]
MLNRCYLFAMFVFASVSSFCLSASSLPEQVDSLTEQWLRIERQTRELENDWRQTEPTLKQRIALLQAEKAQLSEILSQSKQTGTDVEEKRETLLAQQNTLEAEQYALEQTLAPLYSVLNSIYPTLPELIQQRWDSESEVLTSDATSSQQLQVALAQLSSLQTFNSAITVHESIMKTPDNKMVMMKQLYLGSQYAWFSNSDGQYQGWGSCLSGLWQWTFSASKDGQLDDILTAISIYEKQHQPDYVTLPLDLNRAEL